jgi:hypothetical protein
MPSNHQAEYATRLAAARRADTEVHELREVRQHAILMGGVPEDPWTAEGYHTTERLCLSCHTAECHCDCPDFTVTARITCSCATVN